MFNLLFSIIFLLSGLFISLMIYYIVIRLKSQPDSTSSPAGPKKPAVDPKKPPVVNPQILGSYGPGTHFLDKNNNCISGYSGTNCDTIECPKDNSQSLANSLNDILKKWNDFGSQLQVMLTNDATDDNPYANTDNDLKTAIQAMMIADKTDLSGINRAGTVDPLRDYFEIYNIIFPQIQMKHSKKLFDPLLSLMEGPATIYGNFGQAEDAEDSVSGDVNNPTPKSRQYWQQKQMQNYIYYYKLYSNDKYEWGEGLIDPESKINPDPTFNLYLQTYIKNPSVKPIKNRKLPNSQFWAHINPDTSRSIMSNLTDIFTQTQQVGTCIKNYNQMKDFSFIDLTGSDLVNNSDLNKNSDYYEKIQHNIDIYHTFRKDLRSLGRTCAKLYFLFPLLNIQIPIQYTNGQTLTYHDLFYSYKPPLPVNNMLLSLDIETNRKNLNLSQQDFNTLRCFALLHVFTVDNTSDGAHSCYIRCGNDGFTDCIKTTKVNDLTDCSLDTQTHYGCYCDINATDYISFMGLVHDALVDLRSFKQAGFNKQQGGKDIIRNIEKFIQPLYEQLMNKLAGTGEFTNKSTKITSLLDNIQKVVCKN